MLYQVIYGRMRNRGIVTGLVVLGCARQYQKCNGCNLGLTPLTSHSKMVLMENKMAALSRRKRSILQFLLGQEVSHVLLKQNSLVLMIIYGSTVMLCMCVTM